jgi:hypothetical protein
MSLPAHKSKNTSELTTVNVLLRLQPMLNEELAHPSKIVETSNPERVSATVVSSDYAAPEEPFQRVQNGDVPFMLDNDELRQHLISHAHLGMFLKADVETAFPIHEAYDPFRCEIHRLSHWMPGVWPLRIPLPRFPADYPIPLIVTPADVTGIVDRALRAFPHTARYCPAGLPAGRQTQSTLGPL